MPLLLAASNVTALTLSAVLTFLGRGLRPRNGWQPDRARRSSRRGVALFVGLLLALASHVIGVERSLGPAAG